MQLTDMQAEVSSDASKECCVFEYLYRDASNYKAWGTILLSGVPSQNDIAALRACLESDEYFVAEQIGIPAVYKELWDLSGGPNSDDHALHEFVALREATEDERKSLPLIGDLSSLLKTFQAVTTWDYSLSPNFDIDLRQNHHRWWNRYCYFSRVWISRFGRNFPECKSAPKITRGAFL